jgi:hypothetical protein
LLIEEISFNSKLLFPLHFPLDTYEIKYAPQFLFPLELSQKPPTELNFKCPYFHPIEERTVSPALFRLHSTPRRKRAEDILMKYSYFLNFACCIDKYCVLALTLIP